MRIDEPGCERHYCPVCLDQGNPAGVGSDQNVTPLVHCHISAAITGINVGHRSVRGYFQHGGGISNVTIDSVESEPQRTSNTRNRSRLGASRQRKTRHNIATILCDKHVKSVDGETDWIRQTRGKSGLAAAPGKFIDVPAASVSYIQIP